MATGGVILGDFCTSEGTGFGLPWEDRAADGEPEDLDDTEVAEAERGAGWLRAPEEAGFEAEKGSMEGALCELCTGAGAAGAEAVNLERAARTDEKSPLLRDPFTRVTSNQRVTHHPHFLAFMKC